MQTASYQVVFVAIELLDLLVGFPSRPFPFSPLSSLHSVFLTTSFCYSFFFHTHFSSEIFFYIRTCNNICMCSTLYTHSFLFLASRHTEVDKALKKKEYIPLHNYMYVYKQSNRTTEIGPVCTDTKIPIDTIIFHVSQRRASLRAPLSLAEETVVTNDLMVVELPTI